jgi:glycosyltransferase involved in cell wall biosynthesis
VRAALFSAPVARAHRAPVVMHVRDVLPDTARGRVVRRSAAALATRIAAISRYVADSYCDGLPPALAARVRVVDNPVDLGRFAVRDATSRRAARRELGIVDERPVLAIVGQITAWKGHDVALRTLAGVRRSHPDAVLLVVGEVKFRSSATTLDNAAFRRSLDQLAADLELADGAVRHLGERDDIPRILTATDLLLAPSSVEPFGRSIAEAMAVGVAVLATREGGPAEFVDHDRTGWLLDPRDTRAWSARASQLLDQPARLSEIGLAASDSVRTRFSCERHATAMMELLEAVRRQPR